MRFNLEGCDHNRVYGEVFVGDVYAARGGNKTAAYWIVVAVTEESKTVKCLGVNCDGEIVSTSSYYQHYFCERPKVGIVRDIGDIILDVEVF